MQITLDIFTNEVELAINDVDEVIFMDEIVDKIGSSSCQFLVEIGGNSVANFIQCYAGYDYVTSGWYVIIGSLMIFGGGGFIFFPGSSD